MSAIQDCKRMADYFISDLHLSDTSTHLTQALARFVDNKSDDISTLFVLGDLFDYWIGDDHLSDCARACLHIFNQLPDVRFIAGNRDFLIGEHYAKSAGITLLPEVVTTSLAGRTTVITHGDHLCVDDTLHQTTRTQMRSPQWQQQFLAQPIAQRIALAEEARRQSQQRGRHLPQEIADVNHDAVISCLDNHDAKVLLHGHTHKPAIHDLGHNRLRVVLGDWGDYVWFVRADDSRLSLVHYPIDNTSDQHELAAFSTS